MQRQELLTLITAQLRHFGLEQAAASVLECSGLDLHAPASDKLAELCAAGLAAQDGDEEGETIEAAAEMDDEELAELLSANGLDLDVKKAGHLATPDFSCWYSSQHRGPGLATGKTCVPIKVLIHKMNANSLSLKKKRSAKMEDTQQQAQQTPPSRSSMCTGSMPLFWTKVTRNLSSEHFMTIQAQ